MCDRDNDDIDLCISFISYFFLFVCVVVILFVYDLKFIEIDVMFVVKRFVDVMVEFCCWLG